MTWNPYENLPPAASFSLTSSDLKEGEKLAMPQACDEISQRIVVHVSGISTLNPGFIYRNVRKAIHAYQPTYRRKSAG